MTVLLLLLLFWFWFRFCVYMQVYVKEKKSQRKKMENFLDKHGTKFRFFFCPISTNTHTHTQIMFTNDIKNVKSKSASTVALLCNINKFLDEPASIRILVSFSYLLRIFEWSREREREKKKTYNLYCHYFFLVCKNHQIIGIGDSISHCWNVI